MEIFIIVVAIVAVAAALVILALLQLRVKRQIVVGNAVRTQNITIENAISDSVDEVALDYPNDLILKNGPPPYLQVMKSPELYPLSSTVDLAEIDDRDRERTDVKIRLPTSPVHNERTKRTWNLFLNSVLRHDDHIANNSQEEVIKTSKTSVSQDHYTIDMQTASHDVLPTYDEVKPKNSQEQKPNPRQPLKKVNYNTLPRLNFRAEERNLPVQNNNAFTVSNTIREYFRDDPGDFQESAVETGSKRPRFATL
ncbi:uncharacterized protein LOC124450412 isoform X2 [Xenia sp. Carnegie-2017]|nr:uncharacterized protein LOC124450412 isoform X2 [Xenia sp. Carnegie-2017]XP_046857025.1 uncharacterized protein LOC124450412 isoform X2 [Xenia sp. Carnegie-2017]